MRVVFFGTPAFAVPSLEALHAAGHDVAAVVTQPDRPHGRSRSVLVPPPVKVAALARGLAVLQPERPAGAAFEATLTSLAADLGVVVAYGHVLRPGVLATARLGMVNVHASLLPRWRGAAPIVWAIHAGDRETGVSIMRMTAGLDSGPVWATRSVPIEDHTTAGTLTAALATLGAQLLLATLPRIADGQDPVAQDQALVTLAPKLTRGSGRIDWTRPAEAIAQQVRAFDPAPGAWSVLEGTEVKVFGACALAGPRVDEPAGTVLDAGASLRVATGEGTVEIQEIQPAGKRRQSVADLVRGRGIQAGTRFT